jgi:hypothetical protein
MHHPPRDRREGDDARQLVGDGGAQGNEECDFQRALVEEEGAVDGAAGKGQSGDEHTREIPPANVPMGVVAEAQRGAAGEPQARHDHHPFQHFHCIHYSPSNDGEACFRAQSSWRPSC